MHVYPHEGPVATDTIYYYITAVADSSTWAQLFVGKKSLVSDVYDEFVIKLEDNIRDHGTMHKLISDYAQYEVRNRAQSILQALLIDDLKKRTILSAPYFSEICYQSVNYLTNTIIDCMGDHSYMWFLALIYVCFILNHTNAAGINGTPIANYTVSTSEIIPLLRFCYWKPVYYMVDDSDLPSHSTEKCGCWFGKYGHVGHITNF